MAKIVPFILAGGVGSRLWPLSRAAYAKQFHPLVTAEPLLIDTARRLPASDPFTAPCVICNEENRFAVAAAFRAAGLSHGDIVLEPEGRSTAPAAAVAAHLARKAAGGDALVLLMPSDHLIGNANAYRAAVHLGASAAQGGLLVTFGVRPTRPDPGYGYIRTAGEAAPGALALSRFVEKPDAETAARFLEQGDYFWNAGIFLFHASAFLEELRTFEPDMATHCEKAVAEASADLEFLRLGASFLQCRSVSIDYAVMEKTERGALVPLDAGWSDVGTWDALYDAGQKDENSNVTRGDILATRTSRCYLRAESRLIAASGVEDLVIVETKDAILVTKRGESAGVKQVVEQLGAVGRSETENHLTVHRPWGSYETLHLSGRYQVKQIIVQPGASLSLQRHHHRAEHWIVVKGTARVTIDAEVKLLTENESVYVPLGAVHRLENPGLIPLTLIEVQSGSYLGEDDIVRLEDHYKRT